MNKTKPIPIFAVVSLRFNTVLFGSDRYKPCFDYLKSIDPAWSLLQWAKQGTRIIKGEFHIITPCRIRFGPTEGKGGRKGESHPLAELTENDIRDIRRSSDSQAEIARQKGISHTAVWKIKNRVRWSHVK